MINGDETDHDGAAAAESRSQEKYELKTARVSFLKVFYNDPSLMRNAIIAARQHIGPICQQIKSTYLANSA